MNLDVNAPISAIPVRQAQRRLVTLLNCRGDLTSAASSPTTRIDASVRLCEYLIPFTPLVAGQFLWESSFTPA